MPRHIKLDEEQLGLFGSVLGAAAPMLAYDIAENLEWRFAFQRGGVPSSAQLQAPLEVASA